MAKDLNEGSTRRRRPAAVDGSPKRERQAEERAKKEARRLKEAENLLKLATAKRSSRISARLEKQKEEVEAAEAERKRQAEIAMAMAEQDKQRKMEEVSVVLLGFLSWLTLRRSVTPED